MIREIKRGDIYVADLDPVVGSEQGGVRPVLIISNDLGNSYGETVIVAALTTQKKSLMPTHVSLENVKKIERNSFVLLEQIRAINKSRLQKYLFSLGDTEMRKIDRALLISLGLNGLIHMPFRAFLCSQCAMHLSYSLDYKVRRVERQKETDCCMRCFSEQGFEYNICRKFE